MIRLRFVVYHWKGEVYPKVVGDGQDFQEPEGARVLIDIENTGEPRQLLKSLVFQAASKARLLGIEPRQINLVEAIA